MKTYVSFLLGLCVALTSVRAQTYISPSDTMGIWDFNNNAVTTQSADLMQNTPILFQGSTAYSADAAGRSGLAGDRAMNFGTVAGNHAKITDTGFMGLVNQSNLSKNQITVVFWQKWSSAIANSSSIWFNSPSSGGRGFQSHCPYGDGTIYFDTSGCCVAPNQRINANISTLFPGFNWQQWHHIALVKNGGAKQVWVNGQLLVSQASGADALLNDWTEVLIGQQQGSSTATVRGLIDDFAIFGTSLTSTQIASLAAGASPASLVVPPEQQPPVISNPIPTNNTSFHPAASGTGFSVSTVAPNTIDPADITLIINGIDQSAFLSVTGTATNRSVTYTGTLQTQQFYSCSATVRDQADRTSTFQWSFDTANPATTPTHNNLALSSMGKATQPSSNGNAAASLAIDNSATTFSSTLDQEGSFWELELDRSVTASRIYITAPAASGYDGVLNNTRVQLFDVRDQLIHEFPITQIAPGGSWSAFFASSEIRLIRLSLPPGQTNGAGDHRIAVADVKLVGDASPAYGALALSSIGTVSQSTTNGSNQASLGIDDNPATICETTNVVNSFWQVKLDRPRALNRIEIVNSASIPARFGGLTVEVLDDNLNILATTTTTNPGANATWFYTLPANITTARYVKVSLPNAAVNGNGDQVISFADIALFSGVNYALNTTAYMVRLNDALAAASLANDGNYATSAETTTQSTDGWWETDLGTTQALYSVRCIPFDATTNQQRLSHATVRLYDENHESVYSQHLRGTDAVFNVALPGPIKARYVRVGFENKERSSPNGSIEWYLRLREVQAFGRPPTETGLTSFNANSSSITNGQSTTLTWQEEDVREVSLYPGFGSVGTFIDGNGTGSHIVSPSVSTEYVLVGKDYQAPVIRYQTVIVDGALLPIRISEICASNRLSLRDGFGNASDWIELRNPNNQSIDISGYGLSDNPAAPMKWTFPSGTSIAAHDSIVVMASNDDSGLDAKGYLHTNFSLSASGESVVLTATDGITTIDSILNYPTQNEDLSYGRDANGTLGFLTPTPQAFNLTTLWSGWLLPPQFSHSRGFHDSAFSLTLTNPNPDSSLYYSIDGSEPSLLYTTPLTITGSTAVRATVRRSGYQSPQTITHTYVFRDSVMASPLMSTTYTQGALSTRLRNSLTQLPSICLSIPTLPDDYNERETSIEVFMPDGSPPIQINAGLNRVGGSWTNFAKKSYRVSFRAQYGQRNLDVPLFRGFDKGIPAKDNVDTLDLTAGNHDMAERGFYMANRFVEDTMLEMGSLNPHGRFVHVYINGVYWGQYNAHERLEDSFLATYLGGSNSDYNNVRGNDNSGDNFIIGTPEPPHRENWETARANKGTYTIVKDRVDLKQMIDFMLVWFYGNCESEYRCAGPIASPGSGFKFWSADADGFLRTSALTLNRTSNTGPGGFFGALLAEGHPDFKALLADRIYRHFFNGGALTPEKNTARLNARMSEIQDSLIAECARWGYRTPANWESSAETIRTGLFPLRTSNLFTMLRNANMYPTIDPPVFSQHGGSVTTGKVINVSSGVGTIYYTKDGSDPRLAGGGISPTALSATTTNTTLLPLAATWKYFDQGSLPASNWHTSAYSDSAWASGVAPLGYGSTQTTTVSYGPSSTNKYRTTYFRKTIQVADTSAMTSLTLNLTRDDGAVVYVNGVEVGRSNMPTGTISFSTTAASTVSGANTDNFTIPVSALVNGNNLIAVEIHQASNGSSDIIFDLSLTASTSPNVVINQNMSVKARLLNGSNWSALADATFAVAHPLLTGGPYLFQEWSDSNAAGSNPNAMRFMQTDLVDPPLSAAMDAQWMLPFNLTARSRINGLQQHGVGFINTGSVQTTLGAGFAGAAVVSLNTTGTQDIRVTWTGGTVVPNDRDYGIRLQYRIGSTGNYIDVLDSLGQPVEYVRNAVANHASTIGPVTLPPAAENQALVELRWKYYFRSGTSGSRPQLRLDDIQVSAGAVAPTQLSFTATPQRAQSGKACSAITVEARGANGALAQEFAGNISLSVLGASNIITGTLTKVASNGRATFDDIIFTQNGAFTLVASASALTDATAVIPTQVIGFQELVVPQFIQGAQPVNTERVPFAALVEITHLLPLATYRYAPQLIDGDDDALSEGSGNMIFPGNPFTRTTNSPRFLPVDLLTRHGEFITDAQGTFKGWLMLEPTNHPRFTPGGTTWLRLLLNDGEGGDIIAHYLTGSLPITVLAFGSGAQQGSAVYGDTAATAKNFLVFYEEIAGTSRPLSATPVEVTGMITDTNYAAFYRNEVMNTANRWGTILPNQLSQGIKRVEERDGITGNIVSTSIHPEGLSLTAGLQTGSNAIGLRIPSPTASPFARWQANQFDLTKLNNPSIGPALADPDGDGIENLLEFAFGLDPEVSARQGLPSITIESGSSGRDVVFRYRRLLGTHGLSYDLEHAPALTPWQAATGWTGAEETVANPDGITETVTRRLPYEAQSKNFYRVKVTEP